MGWTGVFVILCMVAHAFLQIEFPLFRMTEDQYLPTGSRLELNCSANLTTLHFTQENLSVYNIEIKKGSQSPSESALFHYYDDTLTVQMVIENVTVKDSGTYICRYGDRKVLESFSVVHIAERPRIFNVTCLSNHFDDLRCWFSVENPSNLTMNWTMQYEMQNGYQPSQVNCSNSIQAEVLCDKCVACPEFQGWLIKQTNYIISIKGENTLYRMKTEEDFLVYFGSNIVKPEATRDLHVTYTSDSSMVQLHWSMEPLIRPVLVDYRITVESTSSASEEDLERHSLIYTSGNLTNSYSLRRLIPYHQYTVRMQAKPEDAVGEIYWSDTAEVNFTTKDALPVEPVAMETGSYMFTECGPFVQIVLYWKNPSPRFWNAPIIGFMISVKMIYGEIIMPVVPESSQCNVTEAGRSWSENITGMPVSRMIKEPLLKTADYNISITLINRAGQSPNSTTITVPNWNRGQKLRPDWVSVETGSSQVRISWYIKPGICDESCSATYYWCLAASNRSFVLCQADVDWCTVELSEADFGKETSKMLNRSTDSPDVKFGVSIATSGLSGGIVWETLRFKGINSVPVRPVYKASPPESSSSSSPSYFVVKISNLIESPGGKPDSYQVIYDEVGSTDSPKCPKGGRQMVFPANFSSPEFKVENLTAGTLYVVCVAAINDAGQSDYGDPDVVEIPQESSTILWKVIVPVTVVTVGTVTVVVIVIIILCKRRIKDFDTKITIPQLPRDVIVTAGTYTVKQGEKPQDDDSGKGSSSANVGQDSGLQEGLKFTPTIQARKSSMSLSRNGTPRQSCKSSVSSSKSTASQDSRQGEGSEGLVGYRCADYSYFHVTGGESVDSVEYADPVDDKKSLLDGTDVKETVNNIKYDANEPRRRNYYHQIDEDKLIKGRQLDSADTKVMIAAEKNKNAASTAGQTGGAAFQAVPQEYVDNMHNRLTAVGALSKLEYLPNGIKSSVSSVPKLEFFYLDESTNLKSSGMPLDLKKLSIELQTANGTECVQKEATSKLTDNDFVLRAVSPLSSESNQAKKLQTNSPDEVDSALPCENSTEVERNTINSAEIKVIGKDCQETIPANFGNINTASQDTSNVDYSKVALTQDGKSQHAEASEVVSAEYTRDFMQKSMEESSVLRESFENHRDERNDFLESIQKQIDESFEVENSGIVNYRNPDAVSLGQGSTFSGVSSSLDGEYVDGRISLNSDEVSRASWKDTLDHIELLANNEKDDEVGKPADLTDKTLTDLKGESDSFPYKNGNFTLPENSSIMAKLVVESPKPADHLDTVKEECKSSSGPESIESYVKTNNDSTPKTSGNSSKMHVSPTSSVSGENSCNLNSINSGGSNQSSNSYIDSYTQSRLPTAERNKKNVAPRNGQIPMLGLWNVINSEVEGSKEQAEVQITHC